MISNLINNIWWKIYFSISAIIATLNVFGLFGMLLDLQVSGVLPILTTMVYALAVYSYAFKKYIFSQRTWRIWLIITIVVHLLRWAPIATFNYIPDLATILIIIIGFIILPFPAWYCLYRLGYGKKDYVKTVPAKKSTKKTTKK